MSQASYRASIRAPSRGLWSGALAFDQFFDAMLTSIRRGLTQGWNIGARQVGVAPGEQTGAERIALQQAIARESRYITGLGEFIEENSRAVVGPGKRRAALSRIYSRLNAWMVRWLDVRNQAVMMGRGDPKLKWVYDPRKKHGETCAKLNGKVKRRSTWLAAGVRPQNAPNPLIECGGWECGCQYVVTDEPLSRGPLPRLP